MKIKQSILDKANVWLTPTFDNTTQKAVEKMIVSSPEELTESFYKDLEFGTGGMRGIMGIGTNRINKYTLGRNTQGISDYMHKSFPGEKLKVVITYDCRHKSDILAKVVADVFSANNIEVYLFSEMRPTPELSFAVRHLHCHCGIVITASHNPPEYNGYKVYWQDGGQLVPPQDSEIIHAIENLNYDEVKFEPNYTLIHHIDKTIDEAFIKSSIANASFNTPYTDKENLKIVFTPLHGTAIKLVPKTLEQAGYKNLHIVPEQAEPNGDFPTVHSPNPEEKEALTMALVLANRINADVVIGTDPDSDRLGIAIRDTNNRMILLNGNQTMVLMTHFLLEQWKKQGKITGKEFIGSTIVSTPMMMKLAKAYNIECKLGLTGFKWIAKMIKDYPELKFIGGGEESFGYMIGDSVRDKDAVTSALLVCEIAAQAKAKGSSIYKKLLQLYTDYGFYKEHLVALTRKGIQGIKEIKQMMIDLRENPPSKINGLNVVRIEDYQNSLAKNRITNQEEVLKIPKSNVLIYYLEDGTRIAARPSGTEPKIKFYVSVNKKLNTLQDTSKIEEELNKKIQNIITELKIN